jgi:hypothetical protein
VPRYLRRPTLRALRAGRAFVETAPTSDVSMVIPWAPRKTASSRYAAHCRHLAARAVCLPAGPSPRRVDPVKGTCCLEQRRLPSCSDMRHASVDMVCFVAELECSAAKHGAPIRPASTADRVSESAAYFGLDTAVSRRVPSLLVNDRVEAHNIRIRPTDFCHPTNLSDLHPRSWLSSCLCVRGG